jgi:uncharacterized protein (DUF1810 family)
MFDAYELHRFTAGQADTFPRAVAELRKGRKRSCWMWFVCPTPPFVVDGEEVGSAKNRRYAIRSAEEGRAYLRFRDADADLRANYLEVLEVVAEQLEAGRTLKQLFGREDAPKFESSVEFFAGLGDAEVSAACDAVLEAAEASGSASSESSDPPSPKPSSAGTGTGGFSAVVWSWIGL